MKRSRSILIAFLLLGFGAWPFTTCYAARGVTDDTIKMGLLLVKTGPIAALGLPEGYGHVDYFRYLNETEGGINGRKIDLIWEDDEFKVEKAVTAYNKLIHRDKVLAISTMGGTPQNMALMTALNRDKVVTIPNGLEEELVVPLKPYMFSIMPFYQHQIEVMFDYIMDEFKAKNPKIGVLYSQTAFGKKCADAARKRAGEYNVELVAELVLPHGAVDSSPQVLALQRSGAEYVIFASLLPAMISTLKDAQKIDYWPAYFAVTWSTDPQVVKLTGDAAKNYHGAHGVGTWSDDTPGMKLLRKVAEKYNRGDDAKKMAYAYGFGQAMVYAEGIRRCGKDVSPENLKKAFETMRNFDTQGIVAPVTFTEGNHAATDKVALFKADVPNKTLKTITTDDGTIWRSPKKLR